MGSIATPRVDCWSCRAGVRSRGRCVDRLAEETAGNPLALIELGELLTPGQLAGEQPLSEPLADGRHGAARVPAPRARAVGAARTALVVAAAAGDGELAPLLAALDALGIGAGPLAEVEAAGLIGIGDGRLVFAHPLVRSAVYAAADARRNGGRRTARSLTRSASIGPTAARGISPPPPSGPTNRSPPRSNTRPTLRAGAAATPPRRRRSSARRS